MKKNGFTLAEVLITLAIIGVVATLTLPALMTNTQEQQARAALKKGINTLTEAAQMNSAIAGFDYSSLTSTSTNNAETQSLYGLLANRASIDHQRSGLNRGVGAAANYVVFFRDGSALSYNPANAVSTNATAKVIQPSDNIIYGISALFDTNGAKGPNLLSNCAGDVARDHTGSDRTALCTNKSRRVIKDQFGVRLRGAYAVPNGEAARWAFDN